jgi:hypothetical protein
VHLRAPELIGEIGIFSPVSVEQCGPGFVKTAATVGDALLKMRTHAVRHEKLGILGPAVAALGEAYLFLAERLTMRSARIVLVRGPEADMAVDDDEGRHVSGTPECFESLGETLRVVGIADPFDVPAVGEKARRDVLAEGKIGVPLDGYLVAVVDPAQVAEHVVPRERRRFAGHAFHHVAVAADCINVVVEDREVGPVEALCQPARGECHADAVGTTLSEGTGRCFDTRGQAIFGVTGTLAADFTESLDIVECDSRLSRLLVFGVDRLHAGEMKQCVKQHRCMAVGQHEAIAIGPHRIVRVKAQESLP